MQHRHHYQSKCKIQMEVYEEYGLTVSMGISFNKIFAKLGSDMDKKMGFTIIAPDDFKEKIYGLAVDDLLYVGKATKKKLEERGIMTIGDLAHRDIHYLKSILGKNGVINNMLMALGVIDQPIGMLYTEFSVLIGTIYLFLPLMIMTLVGVMDQIDNDMMEAAESLGANKLKAFIKVVLPLSVPGILTGAVLVFTGALTAYTTPQLLGGNKSLVLATLIYQRAMTLNDWSGAGVIAAVMIIITLVVMKVLNILAARLDKRGEVDA